jgi:hypothetical protein
MSSLTLTELANRYRSDKGTEFGQMHGYTELYERLFEPMRQERFRLLEIGLRWDPYYSEVDHSSSPSLQMWLDYFPNAEICGFDINDFTGMRHKRLRIFQGDQGNPDDLRRMMLDLDGIDVVIDDGNHDSFHQQTSFRYLFPHLRRDGMYIIEDLHWQPPPDPSLPPVMKTRDVFRSPALTGLCDVSFYQDDHICVVRKKTESPTA